MIHLRLRSEYSFGKAWGAVPELAAALPGPAAALTDTGTWGHVAWADACAAVGKRALFGVELPLAPGPKMRARHTVVLIAADNDGLRELYQVVSRANSPERFYYHPHVWLEDLDALTEHVVLLSGANPAVLELKPIPNRFVELCTSAGPGWAPYALAAVGRGWLPVVTGDNVYLRPEDRPAYEVMASGVAGMSHGGIRRRTTPHHVMSEPEVRLALGWVPPEVYRRALGNCALIAEHATVTLGKATMLRYPDKSRSLMELCRAGAERRGLEWNATYEARLQVELTLIAKKDFEDYFYILADVVQWARQRMFVGPGRGSAAGSLVCFLLEITDIDPLRHGLLFERFIDITRADLPDVDIDFPDGARDNIMTYLREKYGEQYVGRLGTINRYGTQSALGDVGKLIGVSRQDLDALQSMVIKRSTGDARAQFAVSDALTGLDIGKALLKKYPGLRYAGALEGRARYSGTHAAGYLVSGTPLDSLVATDSRGSAQVDKHDAERLNLLKIDVLGLRTLTVLQRCLDLIDRTPDWLRGQPLDDPKALAIFNAHKYWGIFQFEGYALQAIIHQMPVESFADIVAITSLARPGPLHGGATTEFINRRTGREPVTILHPSIRDVVTETYGTVVFQEQVMRIGRELGDLSWEDVTQLRKAMSKSLGEEFFNRYWEAFRTGAVAKGLTPEVAERVWKHMCTFGSWAFNKSHAVSYGLISYWCALLKAHWPLEFAAAQLSHDMSEESAIKLLREVKQEGIPFKVVDPTRSQVSWSVIDGELVGGLTNIKGVGPKMAALIVKRRAKPNGELKPTEKAMLTRAAKLMENPVTPFDDLFEGERRFGAIYRDPEAHKIRGPLAYIKDIWQDGEYVFLARLVVKNLRDLNEYASVAKRGGTLLKGQTLFLNLVLEDDTGSIIARVNRDSYLTLGKPLVEEARIGDWYLWRGVVQNNWRNVIISKHKRMQEVPNVADPERQTA